MTLKSLRGYPQTAAAAQMVKLIDQRLQFRDLEAQTPAPVRVAARHAAPVA